MYLKHHLLILLSAVFLLSFGAHAQAKRQKTASPAGNAQTRVLTMSVQSLSAGAGRNLAAFMRKVGVAPIDTKQSQSGTRKTVASLNIIGSNQIRVPSTMPAVIVWNRKFGTPRLIRVNAENSGGKTVSSFSPSKSVSVADQFLVDNRSLLKIHDPSSEFKLVSTTTDAEGVTHVRFQQQYKGIEVWAKDLYVHVSRSGRVQSLNGRFVPTPAITDTVGNTASSAAISDVEADVRSKGYETPVPGFMKTDFGYAGPRARKVIWYGGMPVAHLAWFVEERTGIDHDWYYFVDAVTGKILRSYDNVDHDGPVSSTGTDLNGVSRSFSSYSISGTDYMIDTSLPMYDAAASAIPGNPVGALVVLDLRNNDISAQSQYYYVESANNQWGDASSVSALYNSKVTYNYYLHTFNRNSINDSGMTVYSMIHVTYNGQPMDNAYWNGYFMCYGDGNQYFYPLAGGLDVAAHELTHGVTQHTANLEYVDQSGALNESMSDCFACEVDTLNWTIGETVVMNRTAFPTGALRDLSNPHNGGVEGDPCWQPATMSEYDNMTNYNGGVHTNSGIPNHAFYLVATAIGRKEAGEIWYKALTEYLTRSAQFVDARIATVSAAGELFGQSSAEVTAVKNAWIAVGVVDSTGTQQAPATMVVGPSYVLLTNTSASDPNSIYMAKSNAVSNSDFFPLSQTLVSDKPAVSDNGQIVLFVDGNHNLKALYTNPQDPQEQDIDTSGVWWSVAIGPGLNSIALTSIYVDTTIYYFDLANNVSEQFKIATQSFDGPDTKTALYADAMSFDPTGTYLMFDAYNQVPGAQGDTLHYWNIGLLNVKDGSISTVLPPQSQGIDLGDPSFSKTSTNRFAFDYWDENSGDHYVMAGDFNTGALGIITGPQAVLGYPSYSPDDDSVAYCTTTLYQGTDHYAIDEMPLLSDKIDGTDAPAALAIDGTYPVWFAIGSRVTAVHEHPAIPTTDALTQNYPNPFNPTTAISYELSANSFVTLKVYDVLGREVETLVDGKQSPGAHVVSFDGSRFASGVYFYRLTVAGNNGRRYVSVRKMLELK